MDNNYYFILLEPTLNNPRYYGTELTAAKKAYCVLRLKNNLEIPDQMTFHMENCSTHEICEFIGKGIASDESIEIIMNEEKILVYKYVYDVEKVEQAGGYQNIYNQIDLLP